MTTTCGRSTAPIVDPRPRRRPRPSTLGAPMPARFVLFGRDHLAALVLTALCAVGLSLLARRHARGRAGAALRAALAIALIAATAATLWAWSREVPLTV